MSSFFRIIKQSMSWQGEYIFFLRYVKIADATHNGIPSGFCFGVVCGVLAPTGLGGLFGVAAEYTGVVCLEMCCKDSHRVLQWASSVFSTVEHQNYFKI